MEPPASGVLQATAGAVEQPSHDIHIECSTAAAMGEAPSSASHDFSLVDESVRHMATREACAAHQETVDCPSHRGAEKNPEINDPDEMIRRCAATGLDAGVNWALDPFHPDVEEVYQASKVCTFEIPEILIGRVGLDS